MKSPKTLLRILIHGRSDAAPTTPVRVALRLARIAVLIVTGLVTLQSVLLVLGAWRNDRQIERHRPLYYSILHQVSGGRFREDPARYELEPLAWFFLKMLEAALADIAILRQRHAALRRLSESAVKVLACFKSAPERRLKLADLAVETGLVRRTVQNALASEAW